MLPKSLVQFAPFGGRQVERLGLLLGPLLFVLLITGSPLSLPPGGNEVVAVALWMLVWWIFESVPLPVTALLPIVLFSLTGVMTLDEALAPYSSKIVYLFFGGFLLALGLEKHGLHKRIALLIINAVGNSPPRIILGFMLSTAALSMWISNTATAVMMLPMALSCLQLIYQDQPPDDLPDLDAKRFSTALVLGIAFSASIGGMGTLIGTPPNLVMRGYFENSLGIEVPFFQWMFWAMPVMLVVLAAAYFLLTFVIFPCHRFELDRAELVFRRERQQLGSMTGAQWRMLMVFAVTALLWMSSGVLRSLLPILPLTGKPVPLTDEVIAIAASIALFVIPGDQRHGGALLDWQSTTRLPWGILLLFGGGLSLASGLEKAGVIQALSDNVQQLAGGHVVLLLILLVIMSISLTEVMSNVALVQVLVPVVAAVALGLDLNPLFFAVPTTLASSCAFMLPMATPPNAIVFATGHVTVRQMIRAGFWMNAVSLIAVLLGALALLPR